MVVMASERKHPSVWIGRRNHVDVSGGEWKLVRVDMSASMLVCVHINVAMLVLFDMLMYARTHGRRVYLILHSFINKCTRAVLTYHAHSMNVFSGHEGAVLCGRFTRDGKHILSGGEEGCLRLWNPKTAACEQTIKSSPVFHEGTVCMLSTSSAVTSRQSYPLNSSLRCIVSDVSFLNFVARVHSLHYHHNHNNIAKKVRSGTLTNRIMMIKLLLLLHTMDQSVSATISR